MPSQDHESRARAVLKAIGTGTIPSDYFTQDARWWWNGGLDVTVPEFLNILAQLHTQTVNGVQVTPGLTVAQNSSVWIEAMSHSPLKDGRTYSNRYIFLFHFDGDRVREVREYSDSAHVFATFDLAPP